MSHTSEDNPTTIEPLLVAPKFARNSLGIGETTFWELVKRGLIPLASYGRKRLVPYPALKELARRIEAGEIAPARQGFSAHKDAIAKSIASRRRKAGVLVAQRKTAV
jgi:hypothetical protein